MSDMSCIYEMNMLQENYQVEQDLLSGRGMDILFCLMDKLDTGRDIAKRLGMPIYSVQLYLQRLVKVGLVKENATNIQNGQIEKSYKLVSEEIEIMNYLQKDVLTEAERKKRVDISAQHFAVMTRNAIKNVNMNVDKPHKIKAYFMKANREDMQSFKKEIDNLFEKYQALENLDEAETYSLFTVMAPYETEE